MDDPVDQGLFVAGLTFVAILGMCCACGLLQSICKNLEDNTEELLSDGDYGVSEV